MRKPDLSKDAEKFLRRLPPKQGRQLATKIAELLEDPEPPVSTQVKSNSNYRRADVGEYRIIYEVEADCVRITLIDRRNDDQIYRKFRRKHGP
jgi:mRNA interferase RelE/StbE